MRRTPPTVVLAVVVALALAACGGAQRDPLTGEPVPTAAGSRTPIPVPSPVPEPPELAVGLGAAVTAERLREDDAYRRAFLQTFSLLTPEQAMFWAIVHPEPDRWSWERADALVAFAEATGRPVRGVVIWDKVLPGWITQRDWTREELRRVYVDHIRTLVSRYRGRVRSWVVYNEPLEADGELTRSLWLRVLGPEAIPLALRTARAADPDAELLINEIAAERGGKLDAYVRLARALVARDVPLDGVGLQNHTAIDGHPTRAQLVAAMRRFARLGLDVHITEMDVVIPPGRTGAAALAEQAAAYRAAARACVAVERCRSIVVWGVTDRWSWKGAERRPLLFTAEGAAKPALGALLEPLRR